MTDEAYVQSLIQQWRDSLEAEPWDEELSVELLDALKKESPEAYQRVVDESRYNEIIGG